MRRNRIVRTHATVLAVASWMWGEAPAQETFTQSTQGTGTTHWSSVSAAHAPGTTHASGTLLLCGGSKLPKSILDAFFETGGGLNGSLVLIPTASPRSDLGDFSPWVEYWKDYAWREIRIVHASDRDASEDPHLADSLRHATAVWISGGDQSRLSERFAGTPVEMELRALLDRGGVLGGTSAGAAICSKTMISDGLRDPSFRSGFGILPDLIIDQHFTAKNRMERLAKATRMHAGLGGIGIDESTGLLIHGGRALVIGEGKIHWYRPHHAVEQLASDDATDAKPSFRADTEWCDGEQIDLERVKDSPNQ